MDGIWIILWKIPVLSRVLPSMWMVFKWLEAGWSGERGVYFHPDRI
jgi:hypothetical protein